MKKSAAEPSGIFASSEFEVAGGEDGDVDMGTPWGEGMHDPVPGPPGWARS